MRRSEFLAIMAAAGVGAMDGDALARKLNPSATRGPNDNAKRHKRKRKAQHKSRRLNR